MIPPFAALFSWPVIVGILFSRLSVTYAIGFSIVGGYLLLPDATRINLPLLPAFHKETIPAFAAFAFALAYLSRIRRNPAGTDTGAVVLAGWLPQSPAGRAAVALIILGAFGTVLTNLDPLPIGGRQLPALRLYDSFSAIMTAFATILPLLLARKFMASEKAHLDLLFVLCVAGFGYSILALYEIRMSPQLSRIVYGVQEFAWIQQRRGDGFRPVVFLTHGLWLAIFFACAALAALAAFRATIPPQKWRYLAAGCWIAITLALSNSLTGLVAFLVFLPAVLFLNARLQILFAAAVAGAVLFYPALRGSHLLPLDTIVETIRSVDPTRASSLQFRLNNEEILLAKANERPLFGWGGWGRARVYGEEGEKGSVTDGHWIITMGETGWIGYIARYGLLAVPILVLALRPRRYPVGLASSGLAIVLAANLLDLIPNAGLTPVTWLVAGALLGRLELVTSNVEQATPLRSGSADRPPTSRNPGAQQGRFAKDSAATGARSYSRFPAMRTRGEVTRD
jgi:hypothetical protein